MSVTDSDISLSSDELEEIDPIAEMKSCLKSQIQASLASQVQADRLQNPDGLLRDLSKTNRDWLHGVLDKSNFSRCGSLNDWTGIASTKLVDEKKRTKEGDTHDVKCTITYELSVIKKGRSRWENLPTVVVKSGAKCATSKTLQDPTWIPSASKIDTYRPQVQFTSRHPQQSSSRH